MTQIWATTVRNYILDENHNPIPCDDMREVGEFYGDHNKRRVAYTDVTNHVNVSTVFLVLDHNFGSGPPMLFETMIFGLEDYIAIWVSPGDPNKKSARKSRDLSDSRDTWRYSTWEEAEKGHFEVVEEVRRRLGME
jgi:hypothetical protein